MSAVTTPLSAAAVWRRIRFLGLVTILVLLVAYSGLDWWSGRRLSHQIARFEAKYGPLAAAVKPNLPPSDNRARLVRASAALVSARPDGLTPAVERLLRPESAATVDDDLRAVVNGNQQAIDLLGDLDSRQQSSWDDGDPQLLQLRQLGNLLYAAAMTDLADGRADQAAERVVQGLDVANSLANEQTLIAQLIRVAVGIPALDTTQRLLAQAEPSPSALEKLADRLAQCRRPDPMRAGLIGEAINVNLSFAGSETGLGSTNGGTPLLGGPLGRVARPLVRTARTSYLAQMEALLDRQTGPRPRHTAPALAEPRWWSPVDRLISTVMPGLERAIETGDAFNSALAGAEIAVALRRFRLQTGTYPDQLSALVPAYFDTVPIDPFTGAAPVYSRQGPGFSLQTARRSNRPLADWRVTK